MNDAACCENCRWWRRTSPESDAGECFSVKRNEYAGAYLLAEPDAPCHLVTNSDFVCAAFEEP